jgi:hypothetical protein
LKYTQCYASVYVSTELRIDMWSPLSSGSWSMLPLPKAVETHVSAGTPYPKFQIEDIAALLNVHLHFGLIDDVTRSLGACAPLSDVWLIERTATMAERPAWSQIFRDWADDDIS